ncbi:MAG: RHS repeat-associated core domain-containing protein [Phycisphaerae bacterium]|nr:RHS repeat-associated core domain-containing protein [Phycisphaerae bacterium]
MIDYTAAGDVETNTAEVLYFLHGALGSVVGLADASGNLVERYEYDPYGRTYITAPNGTARPVSAYGNPFAWTGQRYDPAVRLYHFWARSYSPSLGRWLQRDPLDYVDGVGLNEYVRGGPPSMTDPLGLQYAPQPPPEPPSTGDVVGGDGFAAGRGIPRKSPADTTPPAPTLTVIPAARLA